MLLTNTEHKLIELAAKSESVPVATSAHGILLNAAKEKQAKAGQ